MISYAISWFVFVEDLSGCSGYWLLALMLNIHKMYMGPCLPKEIVYIHNQQLNTICNEFMLNIEVACEAWTTADKAYIEGELQVAL